MRKLTATVSMFCVGLLVATAALAQTPPAVGSPGQGQGPVQNPPAAPETLPTPPGQNAQGTPPPAGPVIDAPPQGSGQQAQERPRMGVMLGQSAGAGVLITDVVPGSPAFNAGLRRGDYITKVGEQKVSDPNAVADIVAQEVRDDRVNLQIWRDQRTQDWVVDLRNVGPPAGASGNPPQGSSDYGYYGNNSYNGQYYNGGQYYGSQYRSDRYNYGPGYWNSYGDPYYYNAGPRDYYYSPGFNRYNSSYYGAMPYYYGNGLYLNGGGRGGLNIGGFGIRW